jgi:hypothetical protein
MTKEQSILPDVDRIWIWKNGYHEPRISFVPMKGLLTAEFVRADYTWKQLQNRATGDDGVDIEVMVKRQAKRIQDLERENNSLRLALQSATEG